MKDNKTIKTIKNYSKMKDKFNHLKTIKIILK